MIKKIFLYFILFFVTENVNAQYIKLDNGIMITSFANQKDLSILSSKKSSYSFLVGADYLEKKWFYLSSQVGYVKIGGQEKSTVLTEGNMSISESKNFIHLNTTFRAFAKTDNLQFFIGIGPYLNILTGDKDFTSHDYSPYYNFKSLNSGAKSEIGITRQIDKFKVGVVGSYMHHISSSAASDYLSLYNNSFSAMLTIGYRIR